MSFLAPYFFAGLAALAVPILVHLIQKERKDVVHFPSLMFVRRIPYQSVQRRKIHNWMLLALRAAAMALLIAAFSRPFLKQDPVQAAALSGAREVVILLDHSASMGYGDRWTRAQDEARKVVSGLRGEDRATLVLFARNVEENVRATTDQAQLETAIRTAAVTGDGTRYGPTLRFAQSLLSRSTLPRKEAVLISDFQKTGWETREEIHLPEGAVLTPVSVAERETSNLLISSAAFDEKAFSGEERVGVTVGLMNRGSTAITNLPVKLEVDGRAIDSRNVSIEPHATGSVTFLPFTVAEANMRGVVRAGSDLMPKDNVFHFVVSPQRPVSVLMVQAEGVPTSGDESPSLYMQTVLGMSVAPVFKVDVVPVSRVNPAALERRSIVVLNDVTSLPAPTDALIKTFVEQGGGLFISLGQNTPWAGGTSPLLPGKLGATVDRKIGRGATLGYLDFSHPALELFKQPRSGDFTRIYFTQYRALTPEPTDRVLMRYDDGGAALVERKDGAGRIFAFTSPIGGRSNNLPQEAMFVPFVLQLIPYLAHYDQPAASFIVGHMLDISVPLEASVREGSAGTTGKRTATGVVVTPGGQQLTLGEGGAASIELGEQGFYSVRMQGTGDRKPFAAAVNIDPAESDLTPMSPEEFVASATGRAAVTPAGQSLEHPNLTPEDIEKKQRVWWVLLVAAVAALIGESVLSNRLSRRFGVGFLQMGKKA